MQNLNIKKIYLTQAFEFSEVIVGEAEPHETCVNAQGHKDVLLTLWGTTKALQYMDINCTK